MPTNPAIAMKQASTRSFKHRSISCLEVIRRSLGAVLLARYETGMNKLSRKKCMTDSHFRAAFDRAKERLRKADVRYVEERDPTRQALLEIYIAVAQKAQHNSFENH